MNELDKRDLHLRLSKAKRNLETNIREMFIEGEDLEDTERKVDVVYETIKYLRRLLYQNERNQISKESYDKLNVDFFKDLYEIPKPLPIINIDKLFEMSNICNSNHSSSLPTSSTNYLETSLSLSALDSE